MKQAAMSLLLLNQVKPGAFGKGTVSSTSCLLAWYLPSSSPGFFTSTSQAEPWRGHRCYSSIVKQYSTIRWFFTPHWTIAGIRQGEGYLAKAFHSPIRSHISVRLYLFNLALLKSTVLWFSCWIILMAPSRIHMVGSCSCVWVDTSRCFSSKKCGN